jgi:Fe-S cluster biosynthesis and repair protein YggX
VAVDVTIHFTDSEQAKVSAWIDEIRPGLTNAQKLALMESQARRLLRDYLVSMLTSARMTTANESGNTERDALPADEPIQIGP